eukprot:UN06666
MPEYKAYNRRLMKLPEHNWGLSIGGFLPEARGVTGNWSNENFVKVRPGPKYQAVEEEWKEQREFAFPNYQTSNSAWNNFATGLTGILNNLLTVTEQQKGNRTINDDVYKCGIFTNVSFDITTGALKTLAYKDIINNPTDLVGGDFGLIP